MATFLQKLRAMSDEQKKFVFYAVIIVSAVILGAFSLFSLKNSIADLSSSIALVKFPSLELPVSQAPTIPPVVPAQPTTDQTTPWQAYINKEQNFLIAYPEGWTLDKESSDGFEVWLQKQNNTEVSSFHLEIASKTQGIPTAEQGIAKSVTQMKTVIKPKESITVGKYNGYEAVGTVCVKNCTTQSSEYAPFSIIYFQADNKIFKIKYAEGMVGHGWDTDWNSWKTYEEFHKILTTFTIIK